MALLPIVMQFQKKNYRELLSSQTYFPQLAFHPTMGIFLETNKSERNEFKFWKTENEL